MRYRSWLVLALVVSLVSVAVPAAAQQSKAVKAMASILASVNHFPNDDQKKNLTAIAAESTTTAQEKVLIQALIGMQHSVAAADKPKVEAVMKDASAPESVKTLATILGRFLHMASADDKATLAKLAM